MSRLDMSVALTRCIGMYLAQDGLVDDAENQRSWEDSVASTDVQVADGDIELVAWPNVQKDVSATVDRPVQTLIYPYCK